MSSRQLYTLLKRLLLIKNQEPSTITVKFVDRLNPQGFREIRLSDVKDITKDRLLLKSGGVIPLHRILSVAIRGRVVWKKSA